MKKNILIIVILLAGLALLYYLFVPGQHHDTHTSQHADIVADHDTLTAHKVVYDHVTDSLTNVNRKLDSANKSLIKGQAATENKLNAKSAEVRTLVAQIREINTDAGYFGHLLDSLEEQVKSLQYLIVQYEQYADSINNVNDSMKITSEGLIQEKDKRIAELQTAYDNLFKAYQQLFADSRAMMKDLKRQKLKTKIAAILGAAGATILLLK